VSDPARAAHPAVSDGRDQPATGGAFPRGGGESVPEVATAREYLRSGLPSIYRDKDSFGMRFLYGLERVLDRQVAIVDSLGAYLSPRLAPPEMVDAIAGWLGLALEDAPTEAVLSELPSVAERRASTANASREPRGGTEGEASVGEVRGTVPDSAEGQASVGEVRGTVPDSAEGQASVGEVRGTVPDSAEGHTSAVEVRRKLLGSAERIARLRGTRAGLELVFEICFPGLRLTVEDHGEVALLDGAVPPPSERYPGFEVHCPVRLEPAVRTVVERAIERQRPIHVARRPNVSTLVEDAPEHTEDASAELQR
jgi:hypothetical protein